MNHSQWHFNLLLLIGLSLIGSVALAADENGNDNGNGNGKAESEDQQPKPVELLGVFEGTNRTPYILQPKEWSEFVVVEAAQHGTSVRAGQVLIRFESEALDDKLAQLARQRRVDQLALRQAEENLVLRQKSMPMDLAQAKRDEAIAGENLANFVKHDRPQRVEDLAFSIEQSENFLSYQREELDQLERMYRADDLTEETEEIILTRSRNAVKSAEYTLKKARLNERQALDVELPRQEQDLKKAVRDTALALEKMSILQPIELNQAELSLEQKKADFQQQAETLKKLEADRELLTIKAKQDGYVYYGDTVAGSWPEIAQMRKTLRKGSTAPVNQTLMNVVSARPMFVRANFAEEHLHQLKKGLKVKVQPTAYPELKLDARVAELSPIPVADGKFEAIIEVKFGGDATLVPGMTAKIVLPTEEY